LVQILGAATNTNKFCTATGGPVLASDEHVTRSALPMFRNNCFDEKFEKNMYPLLKDINESNEQQLPRNEYPLL